MATKLVGSKSVYDGTPYISTNILNGLENQLFLSFVGGVKRESLIGELISTLTSSNFSNSSLIFFASLSSAKPYTAAFLPKTTTYF